jgi:hypothetical protein
MVALSLTEPEPTCWESPEERMSEEYYPTDYDRALHRTLVEFLIQSRQPEMAAALLQGMIEVVHSNRTDKQDVVYVEVPPGAYPLVGSSDEIQQTIPRAVREICKGHLRGPNVELRMRVLPPPTDGWEDEMKSLILQFKGSNQGLRARS